MDSNRVKQIEVPPEYKYVVDRGTFEFSRAIGNVAFLLSQHVEDVDDSFLNSDIFKKRLNRAIEAKVQDYSYELGTIVNLIPQDNEGDSHIPTQWQFYDDHSVLRYVDESTVE